MRNKAMFVLSMVAAGTMLVGCSTDAEVASKNISKAADNFEVNRRIVMFSSNGVAVNYLMVIVGACSIKEDGKQLEVTCKVDKGKFKKHFLHMSNNVSYFVEQGEPVNVSTMHYRVTFKPQSILPDPDFRGSSEDLPTSQD